MKKTFTLFTALLLTINIFAEKSKVITLEYPGTLSSKLSNSEKAELEKLTISGDIDARDLKLIRDALPKLKILDISNTAIKAYNGPGGTEDGSSFYPANSVPKHAFNKTGILLETVKLSDDIVKIDENAFRENTKLKEINLPRSLTEIGAYAFRSCTSLKDIVIPDNVTIIKKSAFLQCNNINSVTFGYNVNKIESQAFFQNSNLIILRSNANTPPVVANDAFSHTNIRLLLVPQIDKPKYEKANVWKNFTIGVDNLYEIHNPVAGGISNILNEEAIDPAHITMIKVTGNLNAADMSYIKANMNLLIDIDLSEASFVNNTIPAESFRNNFLLAGVKLPESITHIGDYAFSGCTNLSSDVPITANLKQIGNNAFYNCAKMTGNLKFPSTLQSIGNAAFNGCSSLSGEIEFTNGLKTIGSQAFKSCSGLSDSLNIPETVTSVGTYAFQECTGLDGVLTLSPLMTSVSNGSFSSCENLSGALVIPESIKTIAGSAFYDCKNISTIEIPEGITTIGTNSFGRMYSLTLIKSNSEIPPSIQKTTFDRVDKESIELNVPQGKTSEYATANYWSEFFEISDSTKTFDFAVIIGENGIIRKEETILEADTLLTVELHEIRTFTITPNEGFKVDFINRNGEDISSQLKNGIYKTCPTIEDVEFEIKFREREQLDMHISIEGNGQVMLDEEAIDTEVGFTITEDDNLLITLIPEELNYVSSVLINGIERVEMLNENQLQLDEINENLEIEIFFDEYLYITVTNAEEGSWDANSIIEENKVYVKKGESVRFTIKPNKNYIVHSAVFNNIETKDILIDNRLTTPRITGNATLTISYDHILSSTETNNTDKTKITSTGSGIMIEGLHTGEQVKVFSIDGILLYDQKADSEKLTVKLKNNSAYIIQIDKSAFKVLI